MELKDCLACRSRAFRWAKFYAQTEIKMKVRDESLVAKTEDRRKRMAHVVGSSRLFQCRAENK
jgi:hypothetical protein